ncbi:MAG: hypothetical protein AAB296_10365 [Candidatus Desantisbacteria bacterium]|mgnify:CR=1 FL=1
MGKKMIMVLGVVLIFTKLASAGGTITNTANLDYNDASGGTYTTADSCDLILKTPPNIVIEKRGRNITRSGTYTDIVVGTSTEIVEYRVILKNTGEETARFIIMMDTLPVGVTFQPDAYGTDMGIKVDDIAQTNQYEFADDKANYGKMPKTIIVGKNEGEDNGNAVEIAIDSGISVIILYQVKID